ncbi:Endonuclease, Uma2 family (restriction endonuclease fold) [Mucilaginibacter pineti]|uniref:Endonuclease, Uma2 family (Restriction endonuclease fold) n=1 Tax=Mucilaginibacter pineti TaxID=1391627 RepID=A0A1G7CS16_9SPHI|nr:Uma2 family endonuclease [Mucilaginibacter pineti]SDE42099.1 Endonuclease, Uma2 family (restriction endonuclease fold) [Mucilaginibacter pineti]
MLITDKKKKYTIDDYSLLEEGAPFQLINYDLIRSPSPLAIHQVISAKVLQTLLNFLDSKNDNGFLVSAPMDVKFDDGNILQPDILYISEERIPELIKDRIEGAPDLIIEILSPSNAYYDLRQKKDIYEKYGVKEYIIIDPVQENADLYLLKEGAYYLHQKAQKTETLNSLLLPGFGIQLSKFFK